MNANFNRSATGDTFKTTGKWYWEVSVVYAGTNQAIGVQNSNWTSHTTSWGAHGALYSKSGAISGSTAGPSFTSGDLISVALDMDNKKIVFYKNCQMAGQASLPATDLPYRAFVGFSSYNHVVANFGKSAFECDVPVGFQPGLWQ